MTNAASRSAPHRLRWQGSVVEVHARPSGARTEVTVCRDGAAVTSGAGLGTVLLELADGAGVDTGPKAGEGTGPGADPAAGPAPTAVLAELGWTGRVSRAYLLVGPAGGFPGGARAMAEVPAAAARLAGIDRHLFEPPPGTLAARTLAFGRRHPRLYAARHVLRALTQVLLGLLGVALLVRQVLEPVLRWVREHIPELPRIPWPDLPDIPWPDLPDVPWPDLPEVDAPPWLVAVLAAAKIWFPVLVALAVAAGEVRRRRGAPGPDAPPPQPAPADERTEEPDAHRRPREAPAAADAHRDGGGTAVRGEGAGRDVDR